MEHSVGGQDVRGSRYIHMYRVQPIEVARPSFSMLKFLLAACRSMALHLQYEGRRNVYGSEI